MDIFIQDLEVEGVAEVLAVNEPVGSHEEGMIDAVSLVDSAVVLDMDAERCGLAFLPEVQAAGNLEIGTSRRHFFIVHFLAVVIVDEEEGVAPFVTVESLEGGGDMLAVFSEVIKDLNVCLGHCSLNNGCGSD